MSRAIYVRTSTNDQDGAAQLHALRRAAGARGWVNAREFVDLGQSGTKSSRPALDQLRQAVKSGEVREVAVFALDRLGRSLSDLLLLLDEWAAAGCTVVSLREGIDLSTSAGRMMMQIIGALAEFERSIIVERVRAGVRKAQEKGTRSGKPIGRPRREVDARKVAELRAAGRSWREIAMAMKVPVRTLRDRAIGLSAARRSVE